MLAADHHMISSWASGCNAVLAKLWTLSMKTTSGIVHVLDAHRRFL